ncbi:MAG: hypothetical protein KGL18_20565 [Burkholderiales bacterium]|nr:hypothetical protein [Burkholderiales bacterium]MDE1925608.1 hypothetical protein [Burkholderiales bacterium]MDE2160045.1 hypothetical protein [Burkholderiales bacterium]MDE2505362.1 hypothetical protein [Burkholderiales bacterium]
MKVLLLVVVLLALLWLLRSGGHHDAPAPPRQRSRRGGGAGAPVPMIACVHCGLHLPRDEALFDVAGRSYCSEAHRLVGPR